MIEGAKCREVTAIVANWQHMIVQTINVVLAVLVVQHMVVMYHHVTPVNAILTFRAPIMKVSFSVAIAIITSTIPEFVFQAVIHVV